MVLSKVLSDCASPCDTKAKDPPCRHKPQKAKFGQVSSHTPEKSHGWIPPPMREDRMKGPCLHCTPGLDQTGTHGEWQIPTTSMWHAQQCGFPSGKQWVCCNSWVCASITCVFAYIAVVHIRLDTVCVLLWSISKLFNFTAVYQYRKV